jgi:hypothetical protein
MLSTKQIMMGIYGPLTLIIASIVVFFMASSDWIKFFNCLLIAVNLNTLYNFYKIWRRQHGKG